MVPVRRAALTLPFLAAALGAPGAAAELLLRDDFAGSWLDATRWRQPQGCGTYYGRTQIRPPDFPLTSVGGALQLPLATFNPSGLSFWGSEIVSKAELSPPEGGGLSVAARVRIVAPASPGLDAALFLYRIRPPATACDESPPRDEIDFELLTNQIGTGRILTNVYAAEPIGGPGAPVDPVVAGFDPREWHVLEIRWWADRVEWRVDGALVRSETDRVPEGPLAVRLNFWAPGADFAEAFASPPDPAPSADLDQTWSYEVDWLQVETVPEPHGPLALGAAALALIGLAGRSRSAVVAAPRSRPVPTPGVTASSFASRARAGPARGRSGPPRRGPSTRPPRRRPGRAQRPPGAACRSARRAAPRPPPARRPPPPATARSTRCGCRGARA